MPHSSKILIASDHAGFELKKELQLLLREYEWMDLGPEDTGRVDYPDYAAKLAQEISKAPTRFGVLVCGSGIGMSIAANKFTRVRAAAVENTTASRLAREHNDANILCLGARFLAPEYAAEIARVFLETQFSTDPRHQGRVSKITQLEGAK